MPARHRRLALRYPVLALSALFLVDGCSVACKGPGCEGDRPATRVAIHLGAHLEPGVREAWPDADITWDGARADGARWSVGGQGPYVVLGMPEADQAKLAWYGLPDPSALGRPQVPAVNTWTGERRSGFGAAVHLADATGDGELDLWVSAPEVGDQRGSLYLFVHALQADREDAEEAWLRIDGVHAGDRLGATVVPCADLTGDGLPELLVSAPWLVAGPRLPDVPPLAGGVLLVRSEAIRDRSGVIPALEAGPMWWGETEGEGAGSAMTCDRDLTGDGRPDIAIGAPWYDGTRGAVYLLPTDPLPPTGPLAAAAGRRLVGAEPEGWFGAALASLFDTPEAPAQLVVGAPGAAGGRGNVLLFTPESLTDPAPPSPRLTLVPDPGQAEPGHLGRWLAVGDLDGDGRGDLLVGAPDHREGPAFDAGRAWIWSGLASRSLPSTAPPIRAEVEIRGTQPFQRVGRTPWIADLDEDGLDDLLLPTRRPVQ